LIHMDGFSEEEIMGYKAIIHSNVINCLKCLIAGSKKIGEVISPENEERAQKFTKMNSLTVEVNESMVSDIKMIWGDAAIQKAYMNSSAFQLPDSCQHCMENIDRIAAPNYRPNDMDLLKCRYRSTGVQETSFFIEGVKFKIVDVGGQRSERKKWMYCFENITSVIFCVALSEYDLKLYEDDTVNRMHESLELWDEVCNDKFLRDMGMIMFLNKDDLFRQKIKKVDLNVCFPEYSGGKNYDSALSYVRSKFLGTNKTADRPIYTHITTAVDTNNIKFVFSSVRSIIVGDLLDNFF